MENINWNAIRTRFPVCSRMTYLNAAGGSPLSVDAAVEGKRYFDEMLHFGDTIWDEWLQRTERVRSAVAGFIGASAGEIGFAPNTSTAMAIIAHIMKDKGHMLTMEDEFPSTTIPWINAGFKPRFVKARHGSYSIEDLAKAKQTHDKILVTSYVQYRTGFRQHLGEVGDYCRAEQLTFVVNATQAFGVFPLHVVHDKIDFLVFSGLKWACSGYGAAGFYIRKDFLKSANFPVAGWRSVRSPELVENYKMDLQPSASVAEAGSPSFAPIFSLGGALELINRIGHENCCSRVLYLSRLLEDKLRTNGFPVVHSFDESHRSGIVILRSGNAAFVVEELAKQNIIISARGEGLRISVNFYNNEDDMDQLVQSLKNLRSHL